MEIKQKVKSFNIQYAGGTDRGKKREKNEDFYKIKKNLFIVADGLGGLAGGEMASQMAVCTLEEFFSKSKISVKTDMQNLMNSAFKEANETVLEAANADPNLHEMATALIVAFLKKQILHLAHMGDVRAYLIRNNEIKQLTEDHSVAAELVKHGHLPASELRMHYLRNRLTRTIGNDGGENPDYNSAILEPGDAVVLCSDGLWDMLHDEEILEVMAHSHDAQINVYTLISKANDAGGKDNITAVVIRF